MYIVKFQDIDKRGVKVHASFASEDAAIQEARKIRKAGRWVIVFDTKTKEQVYKERD